MIEKILGILKPILEEITITELIAILIVGCLIWLIKECHKLIINAARQPWYSTKFSFYNPFKKIYKESFMKACEDSIPGQYDYLYQIVDNEKMRRCIKDWSDDVEEQYDIMREKNEECQLIPNDTLFNNIEIRFFNLIENRIKNLYDKTKYKKLKRIAEKIKISINSLVDKIKFSKNDKKKKSPERKISKRNWDDIYMNCRTITRKNIEERKNKYVFYEDIFIDRKLRDEKDANQTFEELINSDKEIIIIKGDSGCGKTNLLCRFAEDQVQLEKLNAVLFVDGQWLSEWEKESPSLIDLKSIINNKVGIINTDTYEEATDEIQRLAEEAKQYLIIIIDAVNEFYDPDNENCRYVWLIKSVIDIIKDKNERKLNRIKFMISMRNESWKYIKTNEKFSIHDKLDAEIIELKKFSDKEIKIAYPLYKERYNIESTYEEVSKDKETIDMIRNPILLRFTFEAYKNKKIPKGITKIKVMEKYYDEAVNSVEMKNFLNQILKTMIDENTDRIPMEKAKLRLKIDPKDPDKLFDTAYYKLKERNIISDQDETIKFLFEPFLEFVIAKYIEEVERPEEKILKEYIYKSKYLAPLW